MGTVHFDHPMWLTMRGSLALHRRTLSSVTGSDIGMVLRTLGLAAVAAGLSVGVVSGGLLDPSATVLIAHGSEARDGKDVSRLGAERRAGQAAAESVASGAVTASSAEQTAGPPAPELTVDAPNQDQAPPWREDEFASVTIVDGRTVSAGAVTIRLDGLELPQGDQVCRTLDNRLEPCVARAATQLELLTRSRKVACRYRMTTSSEAVGSCRIGSQDLAERMLRTGYVRAAENGKPVIASATSVAPAPR
jgi:endonuclease YncB( thermonuclease family)